MSLPGQYVDPAPPASLAVAETLSDNAFLFCLEVTCGIPMLSWYPLNGQGYMHPLDPISGVYNPDRTDEIVNVLVNGVALPALASVDDVCANTAGHGGWFWDGVANQCLVISLPDGRSRPPSWPASVSPQARGFTVEAIARYRFSDGPNDTGGFRWRPWLTTPGTLSRQVTPDFSSISQVGTGTLVLQNEGHFFDTRRIYNWDAGRCYLSVIPVGTAGAPTPLATFVASSVKLDEHSFTINIQDPKVLTDTFYPVPTYDGNAYPNIDPQGVGKVIPVAYGRVLDVTPVCIDTMNGVFKVAGHAITSFDGIRILNASTSQWEVINFLSVDLSTAQFTLSGADWNFSTNGTAGVAVDFSGKPDANGFLMANPADQLMDLLGSLGLSTDAGGFAAAHARYDVGYVGNNANKRVTVHSPTIYLDSTAKALSTINEIMQNIRAYIQTTPTGDLTMTPFKNVAVSDLPIITDNNTLDPGIVVDGGGTSSQYIQAGQKTTQARVTYSSRPNQNTIQLVTFDNPAALQKHNLATPVVVQMDSLFTTESDAAYLAQAIVNDYSVDPAIWTVSLKWLAWDWMPGKQVRCYFPRHCIDMVCEVLKISYDLANRRCQVTLGNPRGFDLCSGFWCLSTDTTPAGASMAWPTDGEVNAPDAMDQRYRRLQASHWHGADDFAVDTTAAGATWSDLDNSVSGWQ